MTRVSVLVTLLFLASSPSAHAGELPRTGPQAVGLSPARVADLKPSLQRLVDEGKVPGGVALVARHGRIAQVTTFGYRDLSAKTPMTEDTIFAVASMTKPVTCLAVMTLVEQGKVGLDDPVGMYLPELNELRVLGDPRDDTEAEVATVPAKRPVTVRHLLSHTSGISYGVFTSTDPRLRRAYQRVGVVGPRPKTIAELVARLGKVPLAHQPGEGWTYGFSHDVLGRLIEVVSGQGFDQYLQERIFGPLDMRDTSFHVPTSKRDRVATIYDAGEGGNLSPLPKEYGSETFFSVGSGLFSTARDFARFAQMLRNGGSLDGARVLSPGTVAAMTTNQIGEHSAAPGRKYGLGLGLALSPGPDGATPVLIRYYAGGVYSTTFWVVPGRDLVLVLMTQVTPTNHGAADQVLHRIVNASIER
jgi:CubicO group peptidase (beta-lactamase class C family)